MTNNRRFVLVLALFLFLLVLGSVAVIIAKARIHPPSNGSAAANGPSVREPGKISAEKPAAESALKEEFNLPAHSLRVANKTFGFPAGGIPVLMYHAIESLPGNSLGVPPQQFAQEMQYLHQHGYQTLSLDVLRNLIQNPQNTALPTQPILLTFDDGYADNYRTAWPIMRQFGFTGTFFVVTAAVGSGMMTWDNLKDLAQEGNSIGSHTIHHYDLTTLSPIRLKQELADSKAAIEKELGISVFAFCYPSGRYNTATLAMLTQTGYTLAFTTEPGRVTASVSPLTLKRIRVPGGLSLNGFAKLLN